MEKCEEVLYGAIAGLKLAYRNIEQVEGLLSLNIPLGGLESRKDIILDELQKCNNTIKNITEDMEASLILLQENIEIVYGPPPSFDDENSLPLGDIII